MKELIQAGIIAHLWNPTDEYFFKTADTIETPLVFEFSSDIYNRLCSVAFLIEKLIDDGGRSVSSLEKGFFLARLAFFKKNNEELKGIEGYRDLNGPLADCLEGLNRLYDQS
jgi:hypothetical protein